MNRVIKFRAWQPEIEEMWPHERLAYQSAFLLHDAEQLILMQYIGLEDVAGVEIYEGDILEVNGKSKENLVVGYFMGNACFMFGDNETGTPIFPALMNMTKEVIGNIYQNKDLMK